jgi:two-component system response regulator YesN
MSNHATDYLLKPFSPRLIAELAQKVVAILENRKQRRKEYEQHLKNSAEYSLLLKKMLIKNILIGVKYVDSSNIDQFSRLFPFDCRYCMMLLNVIKLNEDYFSEQTAYADTIIVSNIIKQIICKKEGFIYLEDDSDIFSILCFSKENSLTKECYQLFKGVNDELQGLSAKLCGGIGVVVDSIEKLRFSYQGALQALEYNNSCIQEDIISIHDIHREQTSKFFWIEHEELINALRSCNKQRIKKTLDRMKESLEQCIGEIKIECLDYNFEQIVVSSMLTLADISTEGFSLANQKYLNPMHDIRKAHTFDLKIKWMESFLYNISEIIDKYRDISDKHIIMQIKNYISKNYTAEIKLETIACELGISKYYLSRLFKEKVGISLSEYKHHFRISRARKLLETTNLKVYEVAMQVGYMNEYYFSTTFKRIVGLPPVEYKKYFGGT